MRSCALQINLKQELEEVLDGNTKKLSDMEAELSLFTRKIERRQTEVDSMTKRIIATSGGNIEKVRGLQPNPTSSCRLIYLFSNADVFAANGRSSRIRTLVS
eukprot:COSAG02_NODE_10089_length_2028_cov_1.485744_2_plen_102_part_00